MSRLFKWRVAGILDAYHMELIEIAEMCFLLFSVLTIYNVRGMSSYEQELKQCRPKCFLLFLLT